MTLHNVVEYFSAYNAATAAAARPLTSSEAHHLPPDLTAQEITQGLKNPTNHIGSRFPLHDELTGNVHVEDIGDVDIFESNDDEWDDPPVELDPQDEEDDPDPFYYPKDFISHEHSVTDQPPHILAIYALTACLHLQFHLPRVACNALLTILSLILLSMAPALPSLLVTLQSSTRILGFDSNGRKEKGYPP